MTREKRSLVAYVASYGISMLGDRFAELALPLVVLAATGDPAAAGAVGASIQVPYFFLALWLGGQADRRSRRVLMIGADLLRAVCFVVFAWFAGAHVAALWPYLAVGFVIGCGNVVFGIAGSAILPELVAGPRLVRANALVEAGDSLTTVTGPAIAGAVIARASATVALVADAVSFLASAVLLLGLGPSARRPAEPARPVVRRRPMRDIFRDRTQSRVQAALIALSAHGAGVVLAIIYFSKSDLHLSTARIGLILGAAGIGGLFASAAATRWTAPFTSLRAVAAVLWLSGGFVLVLAAAAGFWWALVANGFLDGAVTAAFIATATVRQQYTPIDTLGRVTAASVLCNSIARVAGVAGIGLILKYAGGRTALVADAALLIAAALFVTVRRDPATQPLPQAAADTVDEVSAVPLARTDEGGLP